jgi:transcriptional regulator with XRE-family HTH domain
LSNSKQQKTGFSGSRLRDLRLKAGLSRTALAAAVGRSYGAVEAWEQEVSEPSLRSTVALMRVLDCELEDFYLTEDDPVQQTGPSRNASSGMRNVST